MIVSYFKNIRILAITEFILQLRGLILMPFITRQFGTVNYGVWSQVTVMASTLSMFVVFGTDSAFLRLAPGKRLEDQKRYFSGLMVFLLSTTFLISWPILIWPKQISELVFGSSDPEYIAFLPLGIVWLAIGIILSNIRNWFRVQNHANLYSANILLQSMFSVIATVTMLIRGEGVYELVWYSLIGDFALIAISMAVIAIRYGFARPQFSVIPKMLRFGAPLIPAGLAMWGLNYIDRFFLVRYSSLAQLGIYASANTIAYQVIPILAKPWWVMFSNSSSQLYEENKSGELQRLFDLAMGATLILVVPAIFGLRFLGDRIMALFTTDDFLAGVPVLLLASSAFLFNKIAGSFEQVLALKFKHHLATYSKVTAFGVNLILNIILIPAYGIVGAAIATCASFFVSMVMTILFSYQQKIVDIQIVWPAKILFAALGMVAILMASEGLINRFAKTPLIEILLVSLVGVIAYISILWAMKILDLAKARKAFRVIIG